jgi:hypothetical protein
MRKYKERKKAASVAPAESVTEATYVSSTNYLISFILIYLHPFFSGITLSYDSIQSSVHDVDVNMEINPPKSATHYSNSTDEHLSSEQCFCLPVGTDIR